jgi:hypothetical protein
MMTSELGVGLLPEEVGVHVGITLCEKSPPFALLAMAVDKCKKMEGLRHVV